jgi:hypothetical protein
MAANTSGFPDSRPHFDYADTMFWQLVAICLLDAAAFLEFIWIVLGVGGNAIKGCQRAKRGLDKCGNTRPALTNSPRDANLGNARSILALRYFPPNLIHTNRQTSSAKCWLSSGSARSFG